MPELIRFYIRQCLTGFAVAAIFVALLLTFNIQNLWSLVSGSDVGLLAVFLLWFFNGIVFAGAQFGIRLTLISDDNHTGRSGRSDPARPIGALQPVRVHVPAKRGVDMYRK